MLQLLKTNCGNKKSLVFHSLIILSIMKIIKYVRLQGRPYIHTCRSYVQTPLDFTNGASLARRLARALTEL